MAYILIDESGDLGFDWKKKKTSKYFLITAVFVNRKNNLEQEARKKHKLNLEVNIKNLQEEKSLQVVDFICWSIFRKYEHSDESYIEIIKSRIVQENSLFP